LKAKNILKNFNTGSSEVLLEMEKSEVLEIGKIRMGRIKLIHGLIWIPAFIAYFLPWIRLGEEVIRGYSLPHKLSIFSVVYLIGLLLGLVPLITKSESHYIFFSLIAGLLMVIGTIMILVPSLFIGAIFRTFGIQGVVGLGLWIAFLWSLIYIVYELVVSWGIIQSRKKC